MKFYQKLDGAVHVSAREYDIKSETAINEGQVVKLVEGFVVPADAGETTAILGIAAENHSGKPDAIDPRADGPKIFVIDDPCVVVQCAAPEVKAASGSASTTLVVTGLADFAGTDMKGGYVKCVSKTDESTNTDAIGKVRRIEGFSSGTFTLEAGGTPVEGDVYAVFPPVGFAKGNLDESGCALVLTATADLPLRVMGHDRGLNKINLIAKKHFFAVDA